jgi:cytoskeletal protein CcmA (bactofilin family)
MWWEKKPQPRATRKPGPATTPPAKPRLENPMTDTPLRTPAFKQDQSHQTFLGRSAVVEGELSGKEDLLIEGRLDGNIHLEEYCLTVGAQGQVKAEIHARQVIVHGSVDGNIFASEKIEIRKTGHVVGDLLAASVAIEEGAYFKGSINILREDPQEVAEARSAPGGFGER